MRPPSSVSGPRKSPREGNRSRTSRTSSRQSNGKRQMSQDREKKVGNRSSSDRPSSNRSSSTRRSSERRPVSGSPSDRKTSGRPSKPGEDSKPRRIFNDPLLPEDLDVKALPSKVKTGLRALATDNAEIVGKQVLMMIRLLDDPTPENLKSAERFARASVARAGRVGVVREYAGKVALALGHFQEAKTTLRAAHRILGEDSILIDIACAEVGLARPLKALEVLGEVNVTKLERERLIEARMVSARARLANRQYDAALISLPEKDRQFLMARIEKSETKAKSERLLGEWDELRVQIKDGAEGRG